MVVTSVNSLNEAITPNNYNNSLQVSKLKHLRDLSYRAMRKPQFTKALCLLSSVS